MSILKVFVLIIFVGTVYGHGRLAMPPGRSSAWDFGFDTPVNNNDFAIYCGGFQVSYLRVFLHSFYSECV